MKNVKKCEKTKIVFHLKNSEFSGDFEVIHDFTSATKTTKNFKNKKEKK